MREGTAENAAAIAAVSAEDSTPIKVAPGTTDLPGNIVAFTTTRLGGVSEAPFDSMNLGLHVGDDKESVLANRRKLSSDHSLPEEPVWLNQSHSTRITRMSKRGADSVDSDGAFTSEPGCVLAVLTADCLPVLITTSDGKQLALLHAGWRGLSGGIISNAIKLFDTNLTLQAWLGPAIGSGCFEVGEEVRDEFVGVHADNHQYFTATQTQGKYLGDLYALARAELARHGCESVCGAEYCTYTHSRLFHSHRRDGVASGRMATVAWISD